MQNFILTFSLRPLVKKKFKGYSNIHEGHRLCD
uniref:Uncharacterized protein n=1 Tax=Anguilla anguilla TaxID=7936 RepID=A0A0E9SHT9_ANGAN